MKLKKILIVFLVIVEVCYAVITVKTTIPFKSSQLMDAAVNILTSCYGDRGAIGVTGPLPRNFLTKLWSKKKIPVIIVDSNKRQITQTWETLRTKLRVFVLVASTISEFYTGFYDIWRSDSYHPSASILVFSSLPDKKNGCAGTVNQLIRLRYNGAFHVNLICYGPSKRILIFGFNPHTDWAPPPWLRIRNFKSTTSLTFFPYLRLYNSDDICINLDYDKTNDLGGNIINLYTTMDRSWAQSFYFRATGRPDVDAINGRIQIERMRHANIWAMFFSKFNAVLRIHTVPKENEKPLANLGARMFANVFEVRDSPSFRTIIPPVLQYKNRILTQSRGYKTQVGKLVSVVDMYSLFTIGIILITALIFFKFVGHQHFASGILNVMRMICNAGFTNLPQNVGARTYLACLFVFMVTMHGIYAGNLASLLTSSIPVPHPRTIEDLANFNYTVYTDKSLFLLLNRTKYRERIEVFETYFVGCRIVLSSELIACLDNKNYLMDIAAKLNLYVSPNDIFVSYETFYVAPQIPYSEILSKIILRSFEGDVMHLLPVRVKENRLDENQNYLQNRAIPPRIMNLNDLGFAFILLGFGLGCASIIFIIEVSFYRFRSRNTEIR